MKRLGIFFGALLIAAGVAAQPRYPDKPIRFVVGFPPGSPPDTFARLLGRKLTETWGQPALVENVTGAAGSIAADRVAKAAPDGYTLGLLTEAQVVVNPSLYALPYDPMRDLAPVSELFAGPNILALANSVPVKSVEELVALAKARPGELTFASGGSGSTAHMAGELFKSTAGIDIRHVPYKGVLAAAPDLLSGRVSMVFSPISIVLPMVREGKLHAIAVTGARRSSAAPNLPTIAESGYPGFDVVGWDGLFAPARTPTAILSALHLAAVNALADPDVHARLSDLGLEGVGSSPEEFAALIRSQIPKWAKVVSERGIKVE
jgi:tripartite-type tricarboxylate transporter receptor subunit TctC